MKKCGRCQEEKDITSFYKQQASKDGYQRFCKKCANIFSSASEKKSPDKYLKIRQNVSVRFRDEMLDYKAKRGCAHCDEKDPVCLDLHHSDPSIKDLHPCNSTSRRMFYDEAEKCIVLCANCHRKEHARMRKL